MSQPHFSVDAENKPLVNNDGLHPDDVEVATGFAHENLEGWVPELASEDEVKAALDKAFDYRGDVTLTLKSNEKIDGYIFNRIVGKDLESSYIQLFPVDADKKRRVSFAEVARLEFTGKDRAAGKHWEAWVKKYNEKKAAGEKDIGLHPEALD